MKTDVMYFLALPVILAGCTSVPNLPANYGVQVVDLVNELRCELSAAKGFKLFNQREYDWIAGADLRLELTSNSSLNVGPDISSPLSPGLFVVTASMKNDATAKRVGSFKFQQSLKKADMASCGSADLSASTVGLQGNLGVYDWLHEIETLHNETKIEPLSLNYVVEFEIENTLSAGPKISLLPIGGSTLGIGADVTGKKKSRNILTIAFTEKLPAEPTPPTEVIILNNKMAKGTVRFRKPTKPRVNLENLRQLERVIDQRIQTDQTIIQN